MLDDDAAGIGDMADDGVIEIPFFDDGARHLGALGLEHQQHALLAFREHHLIGGHAGLALRHVVQDQLDADAAFAGHLHGGGGEPGRAHILDGDDGVGLHQLQAGLDEQFFGERIADLHGRAFFLGGGVELGAGHGRAMDAVAPGLAADIDHGIADARGGGEEDFVLRAMPTVMALTSGLPL